MSAIAAAALTSGQVAADHYHDGPGHWWIVFPLFWIALFAFFLIMRFVFLPRRWARYGYPGPGYCGPMGPGYGSGRSVLDERFARGEIDEQEYRSRLAVLDESHQRK